MRTRHRPVPLWIVALLGAGLVVSSLSSSVQGQEIEATEGRARAAVDRRDDALIEERLNVTFGNLESLADVMVEVDAGVVRLGGDVLSSDARELAATLAKQVDGVVAVENDIGASRSLSRRLSVVADSLEERLADSLAFLPLLLATCLMLMVFVGAAVALGRWDTLYGWITDNLFLQGLVRQVARVAVVLIGLLLALEILDATALVGAVLGTAGVLGIAVGFAFRDLVENYIASVLLSLRQPFSPRDHVMVNGQEGKVVRLTSRATILLSLEGNHIRIPNATVYKGTITNFTRKPERRFDFLIGLGVDEDVSLAQASAARALAEIDGVLEHPEGYALVESLGDSSVGLRVYGWVDQRKSDFARARGEAIRCVKEAFDAQGIEMPEPIHRIRVEPAATAAVVPSESPTAASTVQDISADRHLELEIEEERAAEEDDLLETDAKLE